MTPNVNSVVKKEHFFVDILRYSSSVKIFKQNTVIFFSFKKFIFEKVKASRR